MDAPHVILLPFPAQGHIKPMFMLAKLLSCHGEINITFINTEHNQNLMSQLIEQSAFHEEFPNLRFMSIPDGLPAEHPRTGASATDFFYSIISFCRPILKDFIVSFGEDERMWQPPTCIIADGIMSFAIDVAEELEIPIITFRTYNATATWVYFHLQKLIQEGEIPVLEGSEDIDRLVTLIPEMEKVLRRRDLPSICRREIDHPFLKFFIDQTEKMKRATALILNTFDDLEAPIISQLHSIYPKVYTVGPLHVRFNEQFSVRNSSYTSNNGSLRQEDRTCMVWLDSQPPKSVIYVSFGSVVVLSRDQGLEFWYGLVNSGVRFLWAIRPDLIWDENGPAGNPEELLVGTNERGRIVSWAPQEEVLAHPAIGGFLTHSGWNSTLESISSGKPMICWPKVSEQQVNSRCVSAMWNIGLDMKDTCDRSTVEKMVRDLMVNNDNKRDELARSTARIARLAHKSVCEGGSSDRNIKKLIRDLRSIHLSRLSK